MGEKQKEAFDTEYTDNIVCPYCGEEYDDFSEDPHSESSSEFECGSCEKSFLYSCNISISWCSRKCDCLNDGNHEWSEWVNLWDNYYERRCEKCSGRETKIEK